MHQMRMRLVRGDSNDVEQGSAHKSTIFKHTGHRKPQSAEMSHETSWRVKQWFTFHATESCAW